MPSSGNGLTQASRTPKSGRQISNWAKRRFRRWVPARCSCGRHCCRPSRQAEPGCRVPTYRAALEPGEVMPGWGLGEVVESKYGYPHGRFCGDGFLQPPRTSRSRVGPLAQSRQPERAVDTLTDWRMCRPHWLHICLKQSRQADGARVNRLPQDSPTPICAEALR